MATADEFQRYARQCVALARKVAPHHRGMLLATAASWLHLADHARAAEAIAPRQSTGADLLWWPRCLL
jgi:hypothetical protein